jgi:hypothetical protein
MKWLSTQWGELRRQADANPRLKWALLLVALLLCAFVWRGLDGLRDGLQKKAISEEARLHRIRALQGQDIWLARADEASAMHAALLAQLPEATTPGLAQATLQGWLRSLVESNPGGRELNVTVDSATPLEQPAGVLRIHASINGALPPSQLIELVRRIESSSNLVVIETSTIRSNQDNASFALGMNAYYRLPAPSGTTP